MGVVLEFLLLLVDRVEVDFLPLLLKEVVEDDYELPHQLVDWEFRDCLDFTGEFLLLLRPLSVVEEIAKLE